MANKRYLTVRQRCLRQLKKELEKINGGAGYNNRVQEVDITRRIEQATNFNCGIRINVLKGESPDKMCAGREYEYIPIEIWFYKQRIQDVADEFEMFVHDIRKALNCPVFLDESHPQPQMTGIALDGGGATPLYDSPDGTVQGYIEYVMEIFYSENDDRLWDDTYDNLVEVT